MSDSYSFIISENDAGTRIDLFLARSIPQITRASVQRLTEEGHVLLDGGRCRTSRKLRAGERIDVSLPVPRLAEPLPEDIPLTVLYEDSDIIVIDKPAGMTVHPGAGTASGTLVNALLAHCSDLSGIGGELRPGIVHRLDKGTSGVLVAAKNDLAHRILSEQFGRHSIKRIYHALVFGVPKEDRGTVRGIIGRDPANRVKLSGRARTGKHAVTHWKTLERFRGVSLIQLRLETGRTHQIRVHLSESGHPLLGDPVYTDGGRLSGISDSRLAAMIRRLDRQALHASVLGFVHPATSVYMEFSSEMPGDVQRILEYLRGAAAY